MEIVSVNGQLGALVPEQTGDGRYPGTPRRVIGFAVRDGLVWGTYDIANPDKLRGVRVG
ncbi:hypothetical protein AB0941_43145 [Streptomyces sp. NPDC013433]